MTNKVFSADGEVFYEDFYDITYDMDVGDTYYVGEQVHISPEGCLSGHDIDSFLEDLDCRLYDYIHVEEMDDCFQDVTKEAKQELLDFVKEWAKKYVSIPYWNALNIQEKVTTKEDLE